MCEPDKAPIKGHVISATYVRGKKLVMVVVDDVGRDKGKSFWINENDTPRWLDKGMAVQFLLVPIGKPEGSNKKRLRIAVNVHPQEE